MGVEAVFQTNGNTYMGKTIGAFTMPPADNTTTTTVAVDDLPSTFEPNHVINIRDAVANQGNNIMIVTAFDAASRTITIKSSGHAENAPPGTVITTEKPIYLNQSADPTVATIEGNLLDEIVPPARIPDS